MEAQGGLGQRHGRCSLRQWWPHEAIEGKVMERRLGAGEGALTVGDRGGAAAPWTMPPRSPRASWDPPRCCIAGARLWPVAWISPAIIFHRTHPLRRRFRMTLLDGSLAHVRHLHKAPPPLPLRPPPLPADGHHPRWRWEGRWWRLACGVWPWRKAEANAREMAAGCRIGEDWKGEDGRGCAWVKGGRRRERRKGREF